MTATLPEQAGVGPRLSALIRQWREEADRLEHSHAPFGSENTAVAAALRVVIGQAEEALGAQRAETPEPSRPLGWHKGKHAWQVHDGYPRHAHSINGVLTIDPRDPRPHFAFGPPFPVREETCPTPTP